MRPVFFLTMFLGLVFAANAFASEADCVAIGKKTVGGNNTGAFVSNSRVVLHFKESSNPLEMKVTGTIKSFYGEEDIEPDDLTDDLGAYIGNFDTEFIAEDKGYRPQKYKDYHKFDGVESIEDPQRPWADSYYGYMAVSDRFKSSKKFHVAYIFTAGDHFGGVLHFTCSAP